MILGKQINIKVTGICNAACSFCGYNRETISRRRKDGYEPYKMEAEKLISKLPLIYRKGFRILHFTGGEPFMEPEFPRILRLAKNYGFQIRTGTNGSLLNEEIIRELKDIGIDYLWFSIDTFPFRDHLTHRGLVKHEERITNAIELLKFHKINFFGQTVISRVLPQKNDMPDLESHLNYYKSQFGIERFVFCYPMYRPHKSRSGDHLAAEGSGAVNFSNNELIKIYKHIIKLKRSSNKIKIINPYLSLANQIRELENPESKGVCQAGYSIFLLGEDLDGLYPCYNFNRDKIGSVSDNENIETKKYFNCRMCGDQCFRDPSFAYMFLNRPFKSIAKMFTETSCFSNAALDLADIIKNRSYKYAD